MRSLLLIAVIIVPAVASGAKPIALHPANPHYFLWRGKPTVLVTSGEHYGALLNPDFDYVRYFDALKADGLNLTRTFSGVYCEDPKSFGITDNPLAPKPGRLLSPWARSRRPGYAGGGNRFDLTQWDPAYFRRLRDLITQAGKRGVVVEMNLFCPMYNDTMWRLCPMNAANNVNGIGRCKRTEVYTLKHKTLLAAQLKFVRKIVTELRDFDNLYYEVCNEPYFGGVTMDWQHRVVDTIVAAEKPFPARHLISMNIANGRKKVTKPYPGVAIFNFHYCVPPDTVAMNYGLKKVIGENETGFRGKADLLYRTEGWDFLLAGGGLYNNLDYSFTPKHPDGTFLKYRSPGGGSPALRRQLGILKTFLDGFDFVRTKPDAAVIRSVSPQLTASVLAERGKAYAVYLHVPLPKKPKNVQKFRRKNIAAKLALALPAGRYRAEWVDTKTGKTARSDTFTSRGGTQALESPRFQDDVALRVRRVPRK